MPLIASNSCFDPHPAAVPLVLGKCPAVTAASLTSQARFQARQGAYAVGEDRCALAFTLARGNPDVGYRCDACEILSCHGCISVVGSKILHDASIGGIGRFRIVLRGLMIHYPYHSNKLLIQWMLNYEPLKQETRHPNRNRSSRRAGAGNVLADCLGISHNTTAHLFVR